MRFILNNQSLSASQNQTVNREHHNVLKIPHIPTTKTILFGSFAAALFITTATNNVAADDAKIVDVKISSKGDRTYSVSVTIEHPDTGWDHYANSWDVLDEKGELIGSRVLAHPHVNEQPFTRSLSVKIPAGVKTITIVAADSLHGDNEQTFDIEVPE